MERGQWSWEASVLKVRGGPGQKFAYASHMLHEHVYH